MLAASTERRGGLAFVIALAMGLAPLTASAEPAPACSLDPIVVPLTKPAVKEGLPVRAIEMHFEDANRVMSDGSIQPYVKPTVAFRVGVNLAKAQAEFCAGAKEKIEGAGLTFDGCGLGGANVSPIRLTLPGSVNVSKWWSMTGVCCSWFKCRKCEWKGKIFERSISVKTYFDRNISREIVPPPPAPANVKATGKTNLWFVTSGESLDDRSILEKVWDAIAGFFEWVGAGFGADWKLQFSDVLGEQLDTSESKSLDPMNFLPVEEKNFSFSHTFLTTLKLKAHEQRGVWDVFQSSLAFSDQRSTFEDAGGLAQKISFTVDYDVFLKALNDLFESSQGPIFISDPLFKDNFCAVGRGEAEKFMQKLKSKLQGDPDTGFNAVVRKGTVRSAVEAFYGTGGVDEYLVSAKKIARQGQSTAIDAPPLSAILNNPSVVPATGTLSGLANEAFWSKQEYACVSKQALKRHGSVRRIRPFEAFEECLSPDPVSASQKKALAKILKTTRPDSLPNVTNVLAPVSGVPAYRGWYSCNGVPHLCGRADMMAWWQEPSKFGARLGRNYGLQIVDASGSGATEIQAITDGTATSLHGDPGWGNALLLPLKLNDKIYVAVYGHLTSEIRKLKAKSVSRGERLGRAGCNGYGNGDCNETCVVKGVPRTERRLHFELVEVTPAGNEFLFQKIDPTTVMPFAIAQEGQRFLYQCERPNTLAAKITLDSAQQAKSYITRDDKRLETKISDIDLQFTDPRSRNEIQKILLDANYIPRDRSGGDFWVRTSIVSPVSHSTVRETALCTWRARKMSAICVIEDDGGRFEIVARWRSFDVKSSTFDFSIRPMNGYRGFRVAEDESVSGEAAEPHSIFVHLKKGKTIRASIQF